MKSLSDLTEQVVLELRTRLQDDGGWGVEGITEVQSGDLEMGSCAKSCQFGNES